MSRHRHVAFIAAVALSGSVLVAGAASSPSVGAEAVSPAAADDSSAAGYYAVTITATRSVADLQARGADVLGVRDGRAEIVADESSAKELRRAGFTVTRRAGLYPEGPQASQRAAADTFYGGYRTTTGHSAHNAKVAAAHPDLVRVRDIGDSYLKTKGKGGHNIEAVCITEGAANGCSLSTSGKPKMVLMGQIHAREVSTGELAGRWIDELTTSTDPQIVQLRKTRELWVIPIANPDGVDKVASNPSSPYYQRKNMNEESGTFAQCGSSSSSQAGVDLNRNSDFAWNGTIAGACGQTFPGKSAASEPETRAVQNFLKAIYPDKRADDYNSPVQTGATGVFLTLHSYGNYIIHPYSFTSTTKAPDAAALKAIGTKMQASNNYRMGTASETVGYTAPGGTDDWAYGRLGVASYTFEIGSSGSSSSCGGFFPVYSCMNSFWKSNRGAFIAAAQAAQNPYGQ